jgi:hypothetical protein
MRFTPTFAAALFALPILAYPIHEIKRYSGETTGRYIVKLKDTASKTKVLDNLNAKQRITHEWDVFHGFAGALKLRVLFLTRKTYICTPGNFDEATLDNFRNSPDVEYIEEDGIVHATGLVTQFGFFYISERRSMLIYFTLSGPMPLGILRV